jgi:hypothetical protein
MPDNQTIKKDKKYKFTPLEKRFIKIYLLLAVFYSIVSVYLLNTYKNKPKNPLIQNIQWYHFFSVGYRDINPILCSWKPLQ